MNGCFRISLHYFSHVNAHCDIKIIISGNKPLVLLNGDFMKKIPYRFILHYNHERNYNHRLPIITAAYLLSPDIICYYWSALMQSIDLLVLLASSTH